MPHITGDEWSFKCQNVHSHTGKHHLWVRLFILHVPPTHTVKREEMSRSSHSAVYLWATNQLSPSCPAPSFQAPTSCCHLVSEILLPLPEHHMQQAAKTPAFHTVCLFSYRNINIGTSYQSCREHCMQPRYQASNNSCDTCLSWRLTGKK